MSKPLQQQSKTVLTDECQAEDQQVMIMRAIHVREQRGLDMNTWNKALEIHLRHSTDT